MESPSSSGIPTRRASNYEDNEDEGARGRGSIGARSVEAGARAAFRYDSDENQMRRDSEAEAEIQPEPIILYGAPLRREQPVTAP